MKKYRIGETAEFVSNVSNDATILEMQPGILNDMSILSKILLMGSLQQRGVKIITGAKVTEITENSVCYEDTAGIFISIPAETVISAFGHKAYNPLEEAARKVCDEVYVVGCAVKAGNAVTAMREDCEAGTKI